MSRRMMCACSATRKAARRAIPTLASITIGQWDITLASSSRTSGRSGNTISVRRHSRTMRKARRRKLDAGERLRRQPDVSPRHDVLQLSRCARYQHNADLIKPPQQLCLTCHGVNSPNGPRAPSIEAHTRHAAGSRGSQCVECHMPKSSRPSRT